MQLKKKTGKRKADCPAMCLRATRELEVYCPPPNPKASKKTRGWGEMIVKYGKKSKNSHRSRKKEDRGERKL